MREKEIRAFLRVSFDGKSFNTYYSLSIKKVEKFSEREQWIT
jgi:hypothetical protein